MPTSESDRLAQILERLAGQPVLTVGEGDGFARRGGVIGLVVESNLARFEVNLHAAQRTGLLLSSKLLGVARVVEGAAGPGAVTCAPSGTSRFATSWPWSSP